MVNYSDFWGTWWEWGGFLSSSPHTSVVDSNLAITDFPKWFPGMKLNFAENLLKFRDEKIALRQTGTIKIISIIDLSNNDP